MHQISELVTWTNR